MYVLLCLLPLAGPPASCSGLLKTCSTSTTCLDSTRARLSGAGRNTRLIVSVHWLYLPNGSTVCLSTSSWLSVQLRLIAPGRLIAHPLPGSLRTDPWSDSAERHSGEKQEEYYLAVRVISANINNHYHPCPNPEPVPSCWLGG